MARPPTLFLTLATLLVLLTCSLGFEKRIVGGGGAAPKYVRHLVYILVKTNNDNYFTCTGTIIGRRWVLSAAHCFAETSHGKSASIHDTIVFIGSRSGYPMMTETPLQLSRVMVHHGWRGSGRDLRHDVALLELRKPLADNKFHPVLLGDVPKAGAHVVAAGYGTTSERGPNAATAKQAKLVSQSFSKCATRERAGVREFLREKFQTCATSLGFPHEGVTDTCYGDSGGPLFLIGDGMRMRQFGITSFSYMKCGKAGATPWYVRVSAYEQGIRAVMRSGLAKSGGFRSLRTRKGRGKQPRAAAVKVRAGESGYARRFHKDKGL